MYINKLLKKQLSLSAASLLLIIFVIFGSSYALFENTQQDSNTQSMNVGDLTIAFNNTSGNTLSDSDALSITGMNPVTDAEGLALTNNIYSFVIKNTGTIAYKYTITVADNPDYASVTDKVIVKKSGASDEPTWKNIRMNLKRYQGTNSESTSTILAKTASLNETFNLGTGKTNGIIASDVTVNAGSTHIYKLQTWLLYDTTLPNKAIGSEIHLKIAITGEATDPV